MRPTLRPGDRVTAEPVAASDLRVGDWVLMRGQERLFLHRFLGFNREGQLLTKGDGRRAPDSPWPPEALLGRAVTLERQGRAVSISSSSLRERARTVVHLLLAAVWLLLRRVGLAALLLLALAPGLAEAAVTLISFEAAPNENAIHITWETGSETNMSHFYVQRALEEGGEYQRISEQVWAEGDLFGWSYSHDDGDVELGQTYYYRLEAVEIGGATDLHGPISAALSLPVTETPPTPTATAAPTSLPPSPADPDPSSTPRQAAIRFWIDEDHILWGECTGLHWRVENAQAVYFQGRGVMGSEDRQVCPRRTTAYGLRVVTDQGEEMRQVTVHVQDVTPSPSTPTFTPLPPTSAPTATPTAAPTSALPSVQPSSTSSPPQVAAATSTRAPSPVRTPLPAPTHTLEPHPAPKLTPSLTPTPTPQPTRRPAADEEPSPPCGLLLALVVGGMGLILFGLWGFWRGREKE